jgi:lysophospholipase L1-like esterase
MTQLRSILSGIRTTVLVFGIVLGLDALLTGLVLPDDLFGMVETERLARIHSPRYHHDLAPNRNIEAARWGSLRYSFATNSLGFKDRAIREVPKTSHVKRLLFIGDSFTEGNGFSFDDTFPGLVDQALQADGTGSKATVLNAGVSSYSPAIYYRKVRHLLEDAELSVDAVVVFIDISDIDDEARGVRLDDSDNVVSRGTGAADEAMQSVTLRMRSALKQYSSIYRLLSALNRQRKARLTHANSCTDALSSGRVVQDANFFRTELANPRAQWTWNDALYEDWGQDGLAQAGKNMTRLNGFLATRGIRLIVAVYPWPEQIFQGDVDNRQPRFWRRWAAQHGATFLDLFPAFMDKGASLDVYNMYFIPCDVHWNQNGHKLVAEKFVDLYRSLDLRPDPAKGVEFLGQKVER